MELKMMQEEFITESKETDINYDVFNALSLHNPLLGEAYAKFKWNPLGDDFSLDLDFIEKYLENARYKPEEKFPEFLSKDPKAVFDAFTLATKRNKEMITELKKRLEKGEFANFKEANIEPQIKDILLFLEMRQKMLEISIGQLKDRKIDVTQAYKNISGINRKLSELLEEAYQKEFQKNVIIQNLIRQAQIENMMRAKQKEKTPSPKFFNYLENVHNLIDNKADRDKADDNLFDITKMFESISRGFESFKNEISQVASLNQQPQQTKAPGPIKEPEQVTQPEPVKEPVRERKREHPIKIKSPARIHNNNGRGKE